jgi:hypothetical protein
MRSSLSTRDEFDVKTRWLHCRAIFASGLERAGSAVLSSALCHVLVVRHSAGAFGRRNSSNRNGDGDDASKSSLA